MECIVGALPITSPNLSFKEFLTRMNQTMQVLTAEHELRQISGNPIVATKKKRLTNANDSTDQSNNDNQYNLPDNYSEFVEQLNSACDNGDLEAKEIIEGLAPYIWQTFLKLRSSGTHHFVHLKQI